MQSVVLTASSANSWTVQDLISFKLGAFKLFFFALTLTVHFKGDILKNQILSFFILKHWLAVYHDYLHNLDVDHCISKLKLKRVLKRFFFQKMSLTWDPTSKKKVNGFKTLSILFDSCHPFKNWRNSVF